jgi:hypothetical protein
MNHPTEFLSGGDERIVYIRTVNPDELPADARSQIGDTPVYAIHNAAGARLALVADRDLAFVVARQQEMTPVSVH